MSLRLKKVNSKNFISIFYEFDNKLNALFHKNTKLLEGGRIRFNKFSEFYNYKKTVLLKNKTSIHINVVFDKLNDNYLFYSYNILFHNEKLMFHYEPTHKEHFQPHINVYMNNKEFRNLKGEGIHILSHQYHPFEILMIIERYFV